MNARRLGIVVMVLVGLCLALTSRSTLLPERGADHVFYGVQENEFIAEEIAIGNFNGDAYQDIITTGLWNKQSCGGWRIEDYTKPQACARSWSYFLAYLGDDTVRVCQFPDNAAHWARWACLGYDSVDGSSASCDSCLTRENGLQGLAYVFYGGDWSGKDHDIDLSEGGADVVILGKAIAGRMYNGMAAGDMDGDGKDELALAASSASPAGEVYVIRGSNAWPDSIDLADPDDFDDWVLYHIVGRDPGDQLGLGLAMGNLNAGIPPRSDLVVAAPTAGGGKGEAYVFYGDASIPSSVPLNSLNDTQIAGYAQVIYGRSSSADHLGVTTMEETHPPHHGSGPHGGNYEPVGISIGNWDNSGANDLAIGAGEAETMDGKVFVIFGGSKLAPGNHIYLTNTPSASSDACDLRIDGASDMALGAGVQFADADGDGDDDFFLGAPLATIDGDPERGQVFVIYGNTKSTLVGSGVRSVATAAHTDIKIFGKDAWDQFGGHFTGNLDIDDDGKRDIGIAGKSEMTVIFGQSQAAWVDTLNLKTAISAHPAIRILDFQPQQYASSTTIRFANLDGDDYRDLVFGGYDSPGYVEDLESDPLGDTGTRHAGQMWVMKGSDMWKHGAVSSNQTWSGNVFVDGDIVVTGGHTLTIAAGTDVWAWPTDVQKNGLGIDTTRIEIRINDGSLVVQGTEENPVRFLAYDADTAYTEASNKWFGIWIDDDCPSSINYAIVRNAYRGIQTRSSLELKNSIIENCVYVGVTIAGDSVDADSLYMTNTTIRNITDAGSIGVNILGKKAAALVELSTVRGCAIGMACYSKARLTSAGTVVSNTTTEALQISGRGDALVTGGFFASDGYGLRLTDGGHIYAGYTEFKNSEYGIWIEKDGASLPSGEFVQCDIDSNEVGAQVAETSNVEFDTCNIRVSEGDGISLQSGADVSIEDCIIGINDGSAIRCDDSNPEITHNDIENNNGGVTSQNGAWPILRRNKIWNNNNGLGLVDEGTADVTCCGGDCEEDCEDANSFKNNSGFHVSNLTEDPLSAACNWWGKTTPTPGKFYGTVYYMPYLSSDPYSPTSMFAQQGGPEKLPNTFRLTGNAPNPFNPVTTIRYEVPAPGARISIRIYNVAGQLVNALVDENRPAGFHSVVWKGLDRRGEGVASGVYFVRMSAPTFNSTHKVLLLK